MKNQGEKPQNSRIFSKNSKYRINLKDFKALFLFKEHFLGQSFFQIDIISWKNSKNSIIFLKLDEIYKKPKNSGKSTTLWFPKIMSNRQACRTNRHPKLFMALVTSIGWLVIVLVVKYITQLIIRSNGKGLKKWQVCFYKKAVLGRRVAKLFCPSLVNPALRRLYKNGRGGSAWNLFDVTASPPLSHKC